MRLLAPLHHGIRSRLALATLLSMLAGSQAAALEPPFKITLDTASTQVTFELGAVFHTVHGRGEIQETVLTYQPASGNLHGSINVSAGGLTTDNKRRDAKMHEKVLKSSAHPWITLNVLSAEGVLDPDSGGALQLEAELILLGQAHPLSFPVEIRISDMEKGVLLATGAFMVPYVAWGLEDPSAVFLRVDKEVRVSFSVAGTLTPAPAS